MPKYNNTVKITPMTDLKKGQAIMADIPKPGTLRSFGAHPWLILNVDAECIVLVPCTTLSDKKRDKDREADKIWRMANNRYGKEPNAEFFIPPAKQYPPFSKDKTHTTSVSIEERVEIPLVAFYKNTNMAFLTDEKCMDKKLLNAVTTESYKMQKETYDPYDYETDFDTDWEAEANNYRKEWKERIKERNRNLIGKYTHIADFASETGITDETEFN